MSLYTSRKYLRLFFITLLSALASATCYFLLNLFFFDNLFIVLQHTPLITKNMIRYINYLYNSYGLMAVFFQTFSLMSLKVWTSFAVQHHFNLFAFIALTGISRAIRFFFVALLGHFLGIRIRNMLEKQAIVITLSYTITFITLLLVIEQTSGLNNLKGSSGTK